MSYFTSWDANVFLCLVCLGIPEDLSKEIVKISKKNHEKFMIDEARKFHCMNIKPIQNYISFKTVWEKKREIDMFSQNLKLKKEDLLVIRKKGTKQPKECIKQHKHFLKLLKEYNKIWDSSFPACHARVILLDRKLMKLSDWDRKLFLDDLIEKFPVEKNMKQDGLLI